MCSTWYDCHVIICTYMHMYNTCTHLLIICIWWIHTFVDETHSIHHIILPSPSLALYSYVGLMCNVKSERQYYHQQDVIVLFCESTLRWDPETVWLHYPVYRCTNTTHDQLQWYFVTIRAFIAICTMGQTHTLVGYVRMTSCTNDCIGADGKVHTHKSRAFFLWTCTKWWLPIHSCMHEHEYCPIVARDTGHWLAVVHSCSHVNTASMCRNINASTNVWL